MIITGWNFAGFYPTKKGAKPPFFQLKSAYALSTKDQISRNITGAACPGFKPDEESPEMLKSLA